MHVLVTGGAGFVGSHLVEGLVRSGHQVRVLDNFATGSRDNLDHLAGEIELIEATILDREALSRAMSGVEIVFHEAAIPSVPRSVRNPVLTNEVNVTGTLNVLIAARDAGVRRLVYAGSSSAYGSPPAGEAWEGKRVETMAARPMSPYAVAKLAGENYCRVFALIYDLETVCLRYFNVFGPRQDPNSEYAAVIPKFITALRDGHPLTIFGDGSQSRDFTFVANVVAANLLAMTAPSVAGEMFNVGCGQHTSLNELARQLGEIAGVTPRIDYLPARSGDVPYSLADIAKARSLLGYEPAVSLADGLQQTWDYFVEEDNAGRCRTGARSVCNRPREGERG
jgi:UDP-N-acetylglucosamine/UDP-N-acetyl-alpha-D-glucosaminouronate 4-epimerase